MLAFKATLAKGCRLSSRLEGKWFCHLDAAAGSALQEQVRTWMCGPVIVDRAQLFPAGTWWTSAEGMARV